jgi:transcriptional regulator with XRE-family HTH domain
MNSTSRAAQNLRRLIKQNGLKISDVAKSVGTSRQYLASILNSSRQSKKEQIIDRLCLLLDVSTPRLYIQTRREPGELVPPAEEVPLGMPVTRGLIDKDFRHHFADLLQRGQHQQILVDSDYVFRERARSLTQRELAEIGLTRGKAFIHMYRPNEGIQAIRECLKLFQQRQTLQPEVFMPYIIDCFYWLARASYMVGDPAAALRFYTKLIDKVLDANSFNQPITDEVRFSFYDSYQLAKEMGDAEQAREIAEKAMTAFTAAGDTRGRDVTSSLYLFSRAQLAGVFGLDLDALNTAIEDTWVNYGDDITQTGSLVAASFYLLQARGDWDALPAYIERVRAALKGRNRTNHYFFTVYAEGMLHLHRGEREIARKYVNRLKVLYASGGYMERYQSLVHHLEAEIAMAENNPDLALTEMLEALYFTKSGSREQHLYLLNRLVAMGCGMDDEEMIILGGKLDEEKRWFRALWGTQKIGEPHQHELGDERQAATA